MLAKLLETRVLYQCESNEIKSRNARLGQKETYALLRLLTKSLAYFWKKWTRISIIDSTSSSWSLPTNPSSPLQLPNDAVQTFAREQLLERRHPPKRRHRRVDRFIGQTSPTGAPYLFFRRLRNSPQLPLFLHAERKKNGSDFQVPTYNCIIFNHEPNLRGNCRDWWDILSGSVLNLKSEHSSCETTSSYVKLCQAMSS